ncbi:MAG: exonuclease SbcCD subunit D C-terminal domain-containing protein [Candidatus Nanopelagicales bacterium]
MRLIHTSDWHLGRRLFDQDLTEDQTAFCTWLLEQAQRHEVDAVVVAGDVYDRAVPPLEAVRLLDHTFAAFAAARVPLLVTSGNHDSAVRLGFGGELSETAGIHLRTSVADIDRPLVLTDEHGEVACYGIPYLLPDAVMTELGAQRSHTSVLAKAVERIQADAARRGIGRTVVAAHAFVTGAATCESERDIRVGGIADADVGVFEGISYVALGHLHGQQSLTAPAGTSAAYSGSPLAFSFSERHHTKSVTLVDLDGAGEVSTTLLPTPVTRPLRELRGRLDQLLARADGEPADVRDAWLKVVLTDPARPADPMQRLRAAWPHTIVLDFAPEGGLPDEDLARLATLTDPLEICAEFIAYVDNARPDPAALAVLRGAVESATAGVNEEATL